MTEDIWSEKPDWKAEVIEKDGKPFFDEDPIPIFEEMDAFHENLKSYFDESIADCHHSLELVAKKLGEYTEKAEKWNELCEGLKYGGNTPVRNILQEINLIDRDNELRRNKLEAIRMAVKGYEGMAALQDPLDLDLAKRIKEILEDEA